MLKKGGAEREAERNSAGGEQDCFAKVCLVSAETGSQAW